MLCTIGLDKPLDVLVTLLHTNYVCYSVTMQVSRTQLLTTLWSSKGVALFPYIACDHLCVSECWFSTSGKDGNEGNNSPKVIHKVGDREIKLPDPPTNCCMSGCQNCVWLAYAEELKDTLCSKSEEHMKIILDQISDPNMKAFLKFEMSHKSNDCRYRPTSSDAPEK